MSYTDALLEFSVVQALTATATSTNVIDTSIADGFGTGEPMAIQINVIVAADSTTGNETYEFQLQTGSTDTPTSVIAKVGFGGSNELAETVLTAGYIVTLPIPPGTTPDRYLRVNYVLGGTTPTISVSASVKPVSMIPNNFSGGHQDNITII